MKSNRRIKRIMASLIAIAILLTPPFAALKSMAVMSVYSSIHKKNSVYTCNGFKINVPGGLTTSERDWFPFAMTFNDNKGFQSFTGNNDLSLSVIYNFPSFSLLRGCSRLFDPSSEYCGSFYGAYAVSDKSGKKYGFDDNGNIDSNKIAEVPKFDMLWLVLRDFGLKREDMVFDWNITCIENISYIGYNNWVKADAVLTVNSTCHRPKGFCQSYLQYGIPGYDISESFQPTSMYGRIYARYFDEYNCSVFFYILTPDIQVLESCDKNILSKSTIEDCF